MTEHVDNSSKRGFKLQCSGCHSCKEAHTYEQTRLCFGCCICFDPSSCAGCCECNEPWPLEPDMSVNALTVERLTRDGWSMIGESIWTRISLKTDQIELVSHDYGIGTGTIDIFFSCSSGDESIKTICEDIAVQLNGHRDYHECDCDWMYLDHRQEGSGQQWRYGSDGFGFPCLSASRLKGNDRKLCDRRAGPGCHVKQLMQDHDDLCGCGCFGTSELQASVTEKTGVSARHATAVTYQREFHELISRIGECTILDPVQHTSDPRAHRILPTQIEDDKDEEDWMQWKHVLKVTSLVCRR